MKRAKGVKLCHVPVQEPTVEPVTLAGLICFTLS